MATRRLASRATINDWMTQELRRAPDCDACHLSLSYRLREPDASGCNWTDATLRLGSNADARHAGPIARKIVERARQLFSLTDDPEPSEQAQPIINMPFQRRLFYIPKRGHIGREGVCGRPYLNQETQSDYRPRSSS